METKTDKRAKIKRKRMKKTVHHWIGAHKPSFIHCPKKKKKRKVK